VERLDRSKHSNLVLKFVNYSRKKFYNIGLRTRYAGQWKDGVQVSISPILNEQLFCAKVLCAAFMCLQFGFVMFLRKDFGAKAVHKMMVKLTPAWRGSNL
jgi:hypothetical protein